MVPVSLAWRGRRGWAWRGMVLAGEGEAPRVLRVLPVLWGSLLSAHPVHGSILPAQFSVGRSWTHLRVLQLEVIGEGGPPDGHGGDEEEEEEEDGEEGGGRH